MAQSSLRVSQVSLKVSPGCLLVWSLIKVIGHVQLLVAIGTRSPFPRWLSAGSCSQLAETACIHATWPPPSSKTVGEFLSH